jgi:hypothetical protein
MWMKKWINSRTSRFRFVPGFSYFVTRIGSLNRSAPCSRNRCERGEPHAASVPTQQEFVKL